MDGIEPTDFVAAFTGAHGIANGLDAILDAAAALKRRGRRDIKLAFIGDGKEKDRLVERARSEDLECCRFYPPMKKLELARVTGQLDCGLMILANVPAFYYGTSPNKFFDYIAAGLPVVNNYPGWLADMIGENRCGVVVPPNDPEALAEALIALADAPEMRRQMGRQSRQLAERDFARASLAAKFAETLARAAAG